MLFSKKKKQNKTKQKRWLYVYRYSILIEQTVILSLYKFIQKTIQLHVFNYLGLHIIYLTKLFKRKLHINKRQGPHINKRQGPEI